MTNFSERILTGVVLIAIIIFSILFNQYSFLTLIFIIASLGLYEFYNLLHSFSPQKVRGIILSSTIYLTFASVILNLSGWHILLFNIPVAFSIFVAELYSHSENPFQTLAFTFLGIIYITIPSLFLTGMAFIPFEHGMYHPHIVLGFFFTVWASDSGAYAFGKLFGKHPLFKRISPNKTWEGSLGGILCTLIVAIINSRLYTEIEFTHWAIIALLVSVIGSLGDLLKSMMKRNLHVKDSGAILPGHGGILDRFDSSLSSALFVFYYLIIISYF